MIKRIIEFFYNKRDFQELLKENTQMKEVLSFNLNRQEKLDEDIRRVLDSNNYGNRYDKKAKIIELLDDYQSVKQF